MPLERLGCRCVWVRDDGMKQSIDIVRRLGFQECLPCIVKLFR